MSVTRDIVRSWRRPAEVIGRHLAQGRREDRALAYLMIGCLLIFVAQWPRLARNAEAAPGGAEAQGFVQSIAYELFGWLIVWPLIFYALAALLHLVLRIAGGKGSAYGTRLALFWALLAASPAALFYGLVRGILGEGAAASGVGAIWLMALLAIASAGMLAAHWARDDGAAR